MVYASHSHSMLCILLSRLEDIRILFLLATILLLNMVRTHFRLYHNVTRENVSDAMTGLYNRKILTPALEQRLQQLVNTGTLVTFIAIDCDKLKVINDTLGHKEGDRIITHLAKAIQSSIRKSDYAIRLGGDEFCIILIDHPSDLTPACWKEFAITYKLLRMIYPSASPPGFIICSRTTLLMMLTKHLMHSSI